MMDLIDRVLDYVFYRPIVWYYRFRALPIFRSLRAERTEWIFRGMYVRAWLFDGAPRPHLFGERYRTQRDRDLEGGMKLLREQRWWENQPR